VKASRYITHMKKLKDPEEPIATFLGRVAALGDRLGPILFQLPPNWRFNANRLHSFLDRLPDGYRYAFEFRDSSWFDPEAYDLLREKGAAFCVYDLAGSTSPKPITADFIYVRLHGPIESYQGHYQDEELAGWAKLLTGWAEEGKEVYCCFNNDPEGYAIQDARALLRMVEE
jgi:uncharacterized protein YecE (DUF72 family)